MLTWEKALENTLTTSLSYSSNRLRFLIPLSSLISRFSVNLLFWADLLAFKYMFSIADVCLTDSWLQIVVWKIKLVGALLMLACGDWVDSSWRSIVWGFWFDGHWGHDFRTINFCNQSRRIRTDALCISVCTQECNTVWSVLIVLNVFLFTFGICYVISFTSSNSKRYKS